MRNVLTLALVVGMMAIFTDSSEAQCGPNGCYGAGYGYGAGFFANNQFRPGLRGFGLSTPREQQPYFAVNPPVYYSGIVRRPYGISPFPVPAGIVPIEMTVPSPVTIANPYFEVAPPSVIEEQPSPSDEKPSDDKTGAKSSDGNKVTWQRNPYIESIAIAK